MEFKEAKNKFVQTWGALGSQWGINKTMAQIHALLMVSNEAVSMEEVMEELQISRGNASMNLRALMDWGIVYKEYKAGERREFFTAEKDLDELAVKIARERSKREIKPALKILKEWRENGPIPFYKEGENKELTPPILVCQSLNSSYLASILSNLSLPLSPSFNT